MLNTQFDSLNLRALFRVEGLLENMDGVRDIDYFCDVLLCNSTFKALCGGEISSSKSKTARKLDFLNTLKDGDILVCSEISRLSRSTLEILEMVDDLLRRGIRIVFIQHNLDLKDLSNPATKIILHMFSVFAEVERDRISQRTKEALRVLKERGVRLVKPKGSIQYSKFDIYKDKIREWCRTGFSYSSQARALKMSHTALIHYVRTRKIYRGGGLRKY